MSFNKIELGLNSVDNKYEEAVIIKNAIKYLILILKYSLTGKFNIFLNTNFG